MNYNELCPGCGHRMAMHLIEKVIDNKCINDKVAFALDVACCSLFIDKMPYDAIMCPHGRVLSVTKGMKSIKKDYIICSYMGDGAAYSIGLNETIHSAMRNDDVLIFVINNMLYAMTGGQASPTTISNTITASTPYGKNEKVYGNALKIEDLISKFNISYLARASLTSKENIENAYKYIEKAFDKYIASGGFNMVEFISPCPTNNHMSCIDICNYINEKVLNYYRIGEFVC